MSTYANARAFRVALEDRLRASPATAAVHSTGFAKRRPPSDSWRGSWLSPRPMIGPSKAGWP